MGGDLVPGRVLLRNINVGIDQSDFRYQILKNTDKNFTFKCRRGFEDIKRGKGEYEFKTVLDRIFGLEGYFPIIVSPAGNESYLLAPPLWRHISPGMVAPCLEAKIDFPRRGPPIYLSHSRLFHKEKIIDNAIDRSHNYAMVVHGMRGDPYGGCFQALIFQLSRKSDYTGKPKDMRYIDAYFLESYGENLSLENAEKIKEFLESNKKNVWWYYANNISQKSFESITKPIFKTEKKEKKKAYIPPNERSSVREQVSGANQFSPQEADHITLQMQKQREEYYNKNSRYK